MQLKPFLAFSLLCYCHVVLAQNIQMPAEVAIRKDTMAVMEDPQDLEGLTLAGIEIAGISQNDQLRNAEIFLTLMKSKGEKNSPTRLHGLSD